MIEVLENKDDDILEIKVTEKLSRADFDHLEPVIEKHIAESSHPVLLMIMEAFSGWKNAQAFWKDLKMDANYIGKFDRIALIGDAKWEEWGTELVNPFTSTEMNFFHPEYMEHARKWLKKKP